MNSHSCFIGYCSSLLMIGRIKKYKVDFFFVRTERFQAFAFSYLLNIIIIIIY